MTTYPVWDQTTIFSNVASNTLSGGVHYTNDDIVLNRRSPTLPLWSGVRSEPFIGGGKVYFEINWRSGGAANVQVGLANSSAAPVVDGTASFSFWGDGGGAWTLNTAQTNPTSPILGTSRLLNNVGGINPTTAGTPLTGQIWVGSTIKISVDFSTGYLWFGFGGAWLASGDPATGLNPAFAGIASAPSDNLFYAVISQTGGNNEGLTLITDPTFFTQTPPSGFVPAPRAIVGTARQTLGPVSEALAGIADVPNKYYYSWFKDRQN